MLNRRAIPNVVMSVVNPKENGTAVIQNVGCTALGRLRMFAITEGLVNGLGVEYTGFVNRKTLANPLEVPTLAFAKLLPVAMSAVVGMLAQFP